MDNLLSKPSAGGWRQRSRASLGAALAVAAAALALCWPAFLNGFPLLFPDSFEYLYTGWGIWGKLLGSPVSYWSYLSTRSEMYAAGIYLLDRHGLWTIVAAQALCGAWVLWLVVRSVRRRWLVPVYLTLVALLSVLTSAAWYVSYIMPDILGSVLYLCIYLLVFASETLGRWETAGVAVIAWWAAVAHGSYLLMAAGLCCLLGLLWLVRWQPMRRRGGRLVGVIGIVLLTAATQMAVHARLYGRPSLFGAAPPFLMARLLGDGPARTYLQQNCSTLSWTICTHVDDLPTIDWKLLWAEDSIWRTSTLEQKLHLQREQAPLALATLRAYPREQIARSWSNFIHMLSTVGPSPGDFGAYPVFTPKNLEFAAPGSSAPYARTRQSNNGMPEGLFRSLQLWAVLGSVLVTALLLPWAWRMRRQRLLGLAAIVLLAVPMNAFVVGALADDDVRLQDRVLWLLPLLAGVLVIGDQTSGGPVDSSPVEV